MTDTLFEIVHEDDELLVVNKPADLVCHPTKGDEYSSLISRVRLHLGQAGAHMINRLDRETTGIVLLAKCDEAAKELRQPRADPTEIRHQSAWNPCTHGSMSTANPNLISLFPLGRFAAWPR
mgnify:CR=1 FL=1